MKAFDQPGLQTERPALSRRNVLRSASLALLGLALAGCGGGGGGSPSSQPPTPMEGSLDTSKSIASTSNGNTYPLNIYLPPDSAGPRSGLPVVYLLDGDTWFDILVGIAESTHSRIIIVGIGNSKLRDTDYVPANGCTPGGGGEVAFFDFIRLELTPYIEATIGGDPTRRALLGHSHGGSFVLYALFAQAPTQHHFSAYLSSDASISCMTGTAYGWEQSYASAYSELPTKLHVSYATGGNIDANVRYVQTIETRDYAGLVMQSQAYSGTHTGIIPAAFAGAIAFALANGL
jgi:enterochelin esterase-like enzyme